MRILVIENDEKAYLRLHKLVKEIAPEKRIVGRCSTVREALQWFKENIPPTLVLSAVQLPDGLSFEIFKKLQYKLPVIFLCRFDKYAIDAFKANGIHYLSKPVSKKDLREALTRYETRFFSMRHSPIKDPPLNGHHLLYQERFIVQVGKQMKLVPVEEIAYFYTENKIVYLVTYANEKYSTDYTLEELEKMLNPKLFFRANRQYITNISSIVKMMPASKSRLELSLRPETRQGIITSFERTADFRKWLTGA